MKNNRLKNAKAITLIALIVSIIVLLILAGVSIAVLTGENGIINRTTEAKKTTEEAEVAEKIRLAFLNAQIGKYAGKNEDFAAVMQAELVKTLGPGATVETNGDDFKVRYNGMIFDVTKTGVVNKVEGISIANTLTLQIVDAETERETKTPKSLTATLNGISGTVTWSKTDGTGSVSLSETTENTISVTPVSVGTATITASCGGKSSTCTVTIESVTTVGVTFNVNGGTFASGENGTRRGVAEEDMTLPVAPTITGGNVFKGWYTASSGGEIVYNKNLTAAKFPASDTEVYAQYGPDVATVDEVGDGTSTVWYNNSANWEVFFKDNGRTYLIYKDATAPYTSLNAPIINSMNCSKIYDNKNSYYPTTTGGTTNETHTHLTDYLSDTTRFPAVTNWLTKYTGWMAQSTSNVSDAGNMAFTLFMLDQNVWKYGTLTPENNTPVGAYYDPNYADWVIGGPTMEMMVATANTGRNQSYSCSVSQANGYSTSGINSSGSLPTGTLWNHSGDSNHYYWLSCPCYGSGRYAANVGPGNISWFMNGRDSYVTASYYNDTLGYRPVVCLKSGVSLTTEGASAKGTDYVLTKE